MSFFPLVIFGTFPNYKNCLIWLPPASIHKSNLLLIDWPTVYKIRELLLIALHSAILFKLLLFFNILYFEKKEKIIFRYVLQNLTEVQKKSPFSGCPLWRGNIFDICLYQLHKNTSGITPLIFGSGLANVLYIAILTKSPSTFGHLRSISCVPLNNGCLLSLPNTQCNLLRWE